MAEVFLSLDHFTIIISILEIKENEQMATNVKKENQFSNS